MNTTHLAAAAITAALVAWAPAWAQEGSASSNQGERQAERAGKAQKTGKAEQADMRESSIPAADSRFATKAAEGGMAEVELGNLAKEKASNDAVKQFGDRMVQDHTKANDELKQLASQKNINLPTTMDSKMQAEKDRLEKLSGAEFDKAYMRYMVSDHKKDVAEFQHQADRGQDSDLKAFASKTLPTLQEHLKLAQQTQSQLK
jgi:putative membrane protein